jgi:citronellol/citronellal dehydrogenase
MALRFARAGADIVIAGNAAQPGAALASPIFAAARQIERHGVACLPLSMDITQEEQVAESVETVLNRFGRIDICINSASAMSLARPSSTDLERYDLITRTNARGCFILAKMAQRGLRRSDNPHFLAITPPLTSDAGLLAATGIYGASKISETLGLLALAQDWRTLGIACNALWPMTLIDTPALRFMFGAERVAGASRAPAIMADAAFAIVQRDAGTATGRTLIDELVLREEGDVDLSAYALDPHGVRARAMFVDDALAAMSAEPLSRALSPGP